jgi:regulatory protein
MKITSAEQQKNNKDRYSIYIDGKYEFSVAEEDYIRLGLYEEKELTQEDIDYIKNCVNLNSAKYMGLKFISIKLRTGSEVRNKLQENGFDKDTIEAAIEELRAMGYLNDRIYVQKYLYDRSKLKPKSKKLLKMELQNKGLETELIDELLSSLDVDEESIAENLLRKKFGKYDLNDEKIKKKAYAFLHHRGFNFGLIEQTVKKVALSEKEQ